MSSNSLFAILLRSPWWMSFALAAAIALVAAAVLPPAYAPFGALGAIPIVVVGCIAAWRQWRAPSASQIATVREQLRQLTWNALATRLSTAWQHQGYQVAPCTTPGADLLLTQGPRTTLVSARRWKAANHGIDALRELHQAMQTHEAAQGIYLLGDGALSETAQAFANTHAIAVLQGDALASWLAASQQ